MLNNDTDKYFYHKLVDFEEHLCLIKCLRTLSTAGFYSGLCLGVIPNARDQSWASHIQNMYSRSLSCVSGLHFFFKYLVF